jgi:hypothetical protein
MCRRRSSSRRWWRRLLRGRSAAVCIRARRGAGGGLAGMAERSSSVALREGATQAGVEEVPAGPFWAVSTGSSLGGEWGVERLTPAGLSPRERRAWGFPGEVSPAHMRSSISASLLGRAESPFSGEVGTGQLDRPTLPNNQTWKKVGWGGRIWLHPVYQTHPKKPATCHRCFATLC